MIRHRDVGIVPFAQDAQSLKIPRLSLQRIRSELAARPPNAERWHVGLPLAQLPFHVQLNRQAMTVIAGDIRRVVTHHGPRFDYHVLKNFVQRGTQMNVRVCIRRPIMQDELWCASARFLDPIVEAQLRPFLESRGFCLWQVRLLRELRLRQVDR